VRVGEPGPANEARRLDERRRAVVGPSVTAPGPARKKFRGASSAANEVVCLPASPSTRRNCEVSTRAGSATLTSAPSWVMWESPRSSG
jgi:hypothetical protein